VWIERVDVRGFRGLAGEFLFSRDLTLVIGDNEAGKSSLHEALVRTLYGFSRVERRRARGTSLHERRAPWTGGPYGLVAQLRDDEHTYRVEWDFRSNRALLYDELGNDRTHELGNGRDEVGLGERFLGIDIEDFRQVCCIDQDQLFAVRQSPTLGVALQEAVATAGGGVPVEHAVERLNTFLKSIGVNTATLRPNPTGRLRALMTEQDQIRAELLAAEGLREEIERLAREAAKGRDELQSLEAEREQARQQLLAAEAEELEQRSFEALRLEGLSSDRPDGELGPPREVVEEARQARARVAELEEELEGASRAVEAAGGRVEELETRQRELTAAVDGLRAYAEVDPSVRDEVRGAWAQLELLADGGDPAGAALPGDVVQRHRELLRRVPDGLVEEVRLAQRRVEELNEEVAAAQPDADDASVRVADLEGKQRELTSAVDGLRQYARVDASVRDDVRERWAQLEVLADPEPFVEAAGFAPDPELERYRSDRDELVALAAAEGDARVGLPRWLGGLVVAAGAALAWLVSIWVGAVVVALGVALLAWKLVRRSDGGGSAATLAQRLGSYGAASIEELDSRVEAEERRRLETEAAAEAARRAREQALERRSILEAEVVALLDRVGAPPAELEQRATAYLVGVERHEELREREAVLARVERDLEEARRPLNEQRRLTQEHERAVAHLRDAYAALEVEQEDLQSAAAAFERLVGETEQARRALQQAEAAAEAGRRAREEAAERQNALEEELRALLDRVGAPAAALEQRVSAYLTGVERHEQLREQEGALARVERELEEARRPANERRRLAQEHERAERRLRDAYAAAGLDDEDLASAAEEFERLVREGERVALRLQEADNAAQALRALLGDESLEALEARAAEAKRAYDEHRQAFGDVSGTGSETPQQLSQRISELGDEVREIAANVRALETQVADREEQAGDPARLKERLAEAEATLERLNDAKEAVAVARNVLKDAAEELSREFAPHLNAALERNLSRITGGRYATAVVNGQLEVQVEIRDSGELKPADELSRATKDQLFLVERLEIARLLAPTKGIAPLLLDDPFAHYDRTRLRRGLEVVSEVAQERQVIVFSEDRELIEPARELCPSCAVIELPPPKTYLEGA
jgi:DNA repair exonuclease SbcCD ATPase subunit